MSDRELVYVGDPLCSWCYGFHPVLEALPGALGLPLRVAVGGLSVGPDARVVDARMASFLRGCWDQVAVASDQPFDRTLLDRTGWRYDTEPACRAVVAVRRLDPPRALDAFGALHHAFYVDGVDPSDEAGLAGAVAPLVDGDVLAAMQDPATRDETRADFVRARELGIRGYPCLLLREGAELTLVTQGYRPLEDLVPALTRHLAARSAVEDGDACGVDRAAC